MKHAAGAGVAGSHVGNLETMFAWNLTVVHEPAIFSPRLTNQPKEWLRLTWRFVNHSGGRASYLRANTIASETAEAQMVAQSVRPPNVGLCGIEGMSPPAPRGNVPADQGPSAL